MEAVVLDDPKSLVIGWRSALRSAYDFASREARGLLPVRDRWGRGGVRPYGWTFD